MNEQIRKFAKKSGFSLDADDIYTAKLEHLPITENMEKFAELIVRECLTVISEKTDRTHIYTTFDRGLVEGTIERSMKAVKKHFGV